MLCMFTAMIILLILPWYNAPTIQQQQRYVEIIFPILYCYYELIIATTISFFPFFLKIYIILYPCTNLIRIMFHVHQINFSVYIQKFYIWLWSELLEIGVIRKNWNDTEKISMAPAQGWHAQIENVSLFFILKNSIFIYH